MTIERKNYHQILQKMHCHSKDERIDEKKAFSYRKRKNRIKRETLHMHVIFIFKVYLDSFQD
jgi:hypothetical protein